MISTVGEDGYVSLENRMACGIGACYACVCKKKKKDKDINCLWWEESWIYKSLLRWTSLFS